MDDHGISHSMVPYGGFAFIGIRSRHPDVCARHPLQFSSDMIVTRGDMRSAGVVVITAMVLGSLPLAAQDILSTVAVAVIPVALAHQPNRKTQSTQPLTPKQRWEYYLHRTYGPHRLGVLALETAIDHALRQPSCWDRGAVSYVTRYSRAVDRRMIRNTAELGAGLVTGTDLRYRPLRAGPLQKRTWNAVRSAFIARKMNGAETPAYTRFAALAVAEVGTAHWTGQRIDTGWLAQALASGAVDQMQTNLLDEFGPDLRRAGTRVSNLLRRVFAGM